MLLTRHAVTKLLMSLAVRAAAGVVLLGFYSAVDAGSFIDAVVQPKLVQAGSSAPATGADEGERQRPAYVTPAGAFRVVGYNDMLWMLEALNQRFSELNPDVRFDLVLKGTKTAPAALAAGTSLFAPMGAEFTEQQLVEYRQVLGAPPIGFRVAHAALDPLARSSPQGIYVHRENPLAKISMEQLRSVFTAPPGITTWGQLGMTGSWAHRSIHPCGLAPSTVIGAHMIKHELGGRDYAPGYIGLLQSREVLRYARGDIDALCFANLNHANNAVRLVRLTKVGSRSVWTGSRSDIISGSYPLDRFLYIYIRATSDSIPPAPLCEYLNLALSSEGQRIIAESRPGYLSLNSLEMASERGRLSEVCGASDRR